MKNLVKSIIALGVFCMPLLLLQSLHATEKGARKDHGKSEAGDVRTLVSTAIEN